MATHVVGAALQLLGPFWDFGGENQRQKMQIIALVTAWLGVRN